MAISWLTCLILSVASIAIHIEVRIHIIGNSREKSSMNEKLSTSANITALQWFHSLRQTNFCLMEFRLKNEEKVE